MIIKSIGASVTSPMDPRYEREGGAGDLLSVDGGVAAGAEGAARGEGGARLRAGQQVRHD